MIQQILDKARWAPSGDNTQPWRFEIIDPLHLAVHAYDTREHCVYDLDGHPSQVSHGALLETMAIAASAHGLRADIARRAGTPDDHPVYDVRFVADPAITRSPLVDVIETRSVHRRKLETRPLTAQEKQALEAAVGSDYDLTWFESFGARLQAARLMFDNAKVRLTMPEAYRTHYDIIEWDASESEDRVPDQALGVNSGTLRMMKWAMVSWDRLSTMNTLMGTWGPRLEMDLVPGLACGAHFVIKAKRAPAGIDDYVAAGRAVQRFWLELTRLGLRMQPEMTPLIFARYLRNATPFTKADKVEAAARRLLPQLRELIGEDVPNAVFIGRIGAGNPYDARSKRKALSKLMK
ncbi:MAG: nitroreductase family protein [Telluria sp.]